ncbi:hypothetical protein [Paraliomyxa miuraensis]|uniref:hypothetical protein n=1 Tax=Paraliomyxa miuraensis TaxID=376150 RepID=UPI0022527CB9|nr:hypothetical protein [Paraliomyxa miuraensis]MCX4242735.1 hypothetical protein [Paraliomyxa miuraensis]
MKSPYRLIIEVTTQGNGWTFRLSPRSRVALCERFGSIAAGSSLFIGTDERPLHASFPASTWHHITALLTGLGPEELRNLGGYRAIDSRTGRVLTDHGMHDAA